jgi:hypothetical protein
VETGYGIIHGKGFLGQFYTFLKSLPRGLRDLGLVPCSKRQL